MIHTEIKKDRRDKGDPHVESQSSEWTTLLSNLLLREEPRCSWIQI